MRKARGPNITMTTRFVMFWDMCWLRKNVRAWVFFPMDQRKELTDFCIRWKLIIQKNEHTASDLMR